MSGFRRQRPLAGGVTTSNCLLLLQLVLLAAVSTATTIIIGSPRTPRLPRLHPQRQPLQQQLDGRWRQQRNSIRTKTFRGGATSSSLMEDEYDDDDDDVFEDALEEEEEEEEEEDEDFDDFDDMDETDVDFEEPGMIDDFLKALHKTPPVTKIYLMATFATAAYSSLFNQNKFPEILLLDWKKVAQRLHIWRPFTAFLNCGSLGLSYVLTMQFAWHYMSTLERLCHKTPYDYWIMMVFGQISMVVVYGALRLNPRILGHNLGTFLLYIWSKTYEGAQVDMFGLFTVKAELLPWMMMAQTYLLEGEPPLLDVLGIVFGHIYYYCKTIGAVRAPKALQTWYKTSAAAQPIRALYQPISSEFEAAAVPED